MDGGGTTSSLQTAIKQCTNYNKYPWPCPVGKDGKPAYTHSANAAGADSDNPHDALAAKSFNCHFGCLKKSIIDQNGKCMMCVDTARNPDHKTCNCPILKKLGFKIVKQKAANNAPRDAALQVATGAATLTPAATPSSVSVPSSDKQSGSASIPGASALRLTRRLMTPVTGSIMKARLRVPCMLVILKLMPVTTTFMHHAAMLQ
jgi:hypothetical protein